MCIGGPTRGGGGGCLGGGPPPKHSKISFFLLNKIMKFSYTHQKNHKFRLFNQKNVAAPPPMLVDSGHLCVCDICFTDKFISLYVVVTLFIDINKCYFMFSDFKFDPSKPEFKILFNVIYK
jgi:hypothetical protein